VAGLWGPIPRPVLCDEDLVAILGGKHRSGIERHPDRGHVRSELSSGRTKLTARTIGELGILQIATVTVRIPEVQAGFGRVMQRIRWALVSEHVSPVVREPQFVGSWLPVESDRISDTPREDLLTGAVRIHPEDRGESWVLAGTVANVAVHRQEHTAFRRARTRCISSRGGAP